MYTRELFFSETKGILSMADSVPNGIAKSLPPSRGFPVAEFEARLERAQTLTQAQGLDALLVTTDENIRYFSGFHTQFFQSPTRPWFLVVPSAGKPIAIIPGIGAESMAATWIDDIRTWSSPHPSDDGIGLLSDCLRACVEPGGRIGVPMGRETALRMPLLDFDMMRHDLSDRAFEDATGIIRSLRMQKSEREIEKIAYACQCASDAFEAVPTWLQTGMPDAEIFRRFKIDCLQSGLDDVSYLVGGAGPDGYNDIIAPPSGREIGIGDILILDTGSVYDGYFCDFDRNFALGSTSDLARAAYDTIFKATDAGLATARPGATCADLFHAMQSVMETGGALGNDVGRLGHGLGMQLTEWPSHTPFDQTVLVPGMVLTLEPGMTYAPGKMMVHEENIVIREDGCELLSRRAAPELPIII